jgi:hypothetical protein
MPLLPYQGIIPIGGLVGLASRAAQIALDQVPRCQAAPRYWARRCSNAVPHRLKGARSLALKTERKEMLSPTSGHFGAVVSTK